jgi:hypothetical protein
MMSLLRNLRHGFRLAGDIFLFSFVNRVYWLVPLLLVLLVMGALIVVGQTAAPYLYTLF